MDRARKRGPLPSHPIDTVRFFILGILEQSSDAWIYAAKRKSILSGVIAFFWILSLLIALDNPQNKWVHEFLSFSAFCLWWILLGIASTVGFGSGLQTFVLYLGPHVARFTLKATLCGRTDFKESIYDTIRWARSDSWTSKDCSSFGPPLFPHVATVHGGYYVVPLFELMKAIQLEVFLWGVGTAIGELPPYMVAKAGRLSGEKMKELEELEEEEEDRRRGGAREGGDDTATSSSSLFIDRVLARLKRWILSRGQSFGFFTILLLASIPNPFFDLAGLTCGHFLVPFWKFFLATLVGKSIFKATFQMLLVIVIFNVHSVELLEISLGKVLEGIPELREKLPHLITALDAARERLANGNPLNASSGISIAAIWSTIVTMMLLAFSWSIMSTIAKSYVLRKNQRDALASKLPKSSEEDEEEDGDSSIEHED